MTSSQANELRKNPKIAYLEEDGEVIASEQFIPWGLHATRTIEVQNNYYFTGKEIDIAVLDSGVALPHEDLSVETCVNFVSDVQTCTDDFGHGTRVMGIIGAQNNLFGIVGGAPGANIHSLKVLDKFGAGNYSDIVSAIEWCISNGIEIINMSFGGSIRSKTLDSVLDQAYRSGKLLVASAGNAGFQSKGSITYPASHSAVIAVGAFDEAGQRAEFSSIGKELDILAPGVSVYTTNVQNSYGIVFGTSYAAPYVTSAAALVWEADRTLSNADIRKLLLTNAIELGNAFLYGAGRIDVYNTIIDASR